MVTWEQSKVWCYDDPNVFEEDEELWLVRTSARRPRRWNNGIENDLVLFLYKQLDAIEIIPSRNYFYTDFDKRDWMEVREMLEFMRNEEE